MKLLRKVVAGLILGVAWLIVAAVVATPVLALYHGGVDWQAAGNGLKTVGVLAAILIVALIVVNGTVALLEWAADVWGGRR